MKRARRRIASSDSARCGATFNVINPRQLPEKAEDGRRIWSDGGYYAQVASGLERTSRTAAPRLRHGDLSLEPKGTLAGSISAVARPPLSYLPLRVLDGILLNFNSSHLECGSAI